MKKILTKDIMEKLLELGEQIVEDRIDLNRVLFFLNLILEGIPQSSQSNANRGRVYVLESCWSFDHSHTEYTTLSFEAEDIGTGYESILDPTMSKDQRNRLIGCLRQVYDAQVPMHGNHKMIRLYRVIQVKHAGSKPIYTDFASSGELRNATSDLCFVLEPLFEFDEAGKPMPCKIKQMGDLNV